MGLPQILQTCLFLAFVMACVVAAQDPETYKNEISASWWNDLGKATAAVFDHLPESLRKTAFDIRVYLAGDSDQNFLMGLNNLSTITASVWESSLFKTTIRRTNYQEGATHILLGNKAVLLGYIYYKTLWIFVSTEPENESLKRQLEANIPEKLIFAFLETSNFQQLKRIKRYTEFEDGKLKTISQHNAEEDSIYNTYVADKNTIQKLEGKVDVMSPMEENTHESIGELSFHSTDRLKRQTEHSMRNATISLSQIAIKVYADISASASSGKVILKNVGYWTPQIGLVLKKPLTNPPTSDFQGRRMLLTTVHKPKVFEIHKLDGSRVKSLAEVDGYVAEVMRVLQSHLNFSVTLVFSSTFGTELPNGSWNGMMGDLVRQEAELSPLDFSPSWSRAQAIDFSEWFGTDPVIVISQAPKPIFKPFLMLEIFSIWVWVTIVSVGVVTGFITWGVEILVNKVLNNGNFVKDNTPRKVRPFSLLQAIGSSLKLFVIQGSETWPESWSGRSLSTCFFLVVISVVALYQGYIIAFLAVPRKASPIDSANDLMKRLDKVTPVVRKNTVYYTFVVNFESFHPIAEKLEFYQDAFLDTWEFFQMIYEGKVALIDTSSSAVGRAAMFETRAKECRFYVSQNVLKNDLDMMAHSQNSVFREQVDNKLRQLRSFGIVEKLKRDYYSASCERVLSQRDPIALNLSQIQSAFYLLAAGTVASALSFIAEKILYCFGRR